ncbi:hypothetical protein ID866_8355 [Astraeus odoratus]|nr:hypothetical protein ID866_8355 [Astraeus odoratus]
MEQEHLFIFLDHLLRLPEERQGMVIAVELGKWLTGGDYVKNLLLILLLIFYLHQIIEVPWSLYQASRPRRRSPPTLSCSTSIEDRAASSKLRALELFYLVMTLLSPFLGALLLQTTVSSLSGPASLSWFSISLFVLATGLRPWKHVVGRLQDGTNDLHDAIQWPPSEVEKTQLRLEYLCEKVTLLEAELKLSQSRLEAVSAELYERAEDTYDAVERAARRHEKKTEVMKNSHETRLSRLEKDVEMLLERREIRADTPSPTLLSTLEKQLDTVLPAWVTGSFPTKYPSRHCQKNGRPCSSITLETISEVATFQPQISPHSFTSFRIPGLRLVLRMGDLATLPVRHVVAYLLSGKIYTPRGGSPFA